MLNEYSQDETILSRTEPLQGLGGAAPKCRVLGAQPPKCREVERRVPSGELEVRGPPRKCRGSGGQHSSSILYIGVSIGRERSLVGPCGPTKSLHPSSSHSKVSPSSPRYFSSLHALQYAWIPLVQFHVECSKTHFWRHLGCRPMTTCLLYVTII